KKLKLSKANGKIANDIEVKSGNYDEKDFYVVTEKDPVSSDGKNRWQEAIDAWAREQTDEKWKYPTETSDSNTEEVVVSFRSPGNESKVEPSDKKVEVRVRLTSIEPIKEVKLWVNGSEKKSYSGDREEINETLELENGKYEIKVQAWNEKGKSGDSTIKIGVNEDWK
ncbi:hypothetical protein KBD81_02835, partial [Candidatus Woesebacteria bacterium]|nr:hypothetical protein [Candidatus Woesebacteria bacterium]